MSDQDGVIKFDINWIKKAPLDRADCQNLINGRQQLKDRGYIGVDELGIGFGNISERWEESEVFIITGTQTGHLNELTPGDITKVTAFDIINNQLNCEGPVKASSESLSHGIIYRNNPLIKSVIHIHHLQLWEKLLNKAPTTRQDAECGSIEMAQSIGLLVRERPEKLCQTIVMAGHQAGLIFYGQDMFGNLEHLLSFFH